MGEPATRRATYEELVAVPDHLVAEIINGTLVTSPRPGSSHARAAGKLGTKLGRPFDDGEDGPGGWILLPEPELHLQDDVVVPGMAGWRRERMPVMPETAAFTLVPDWICEVLSPTSTEARDREEKMPLYAREGVGHLWLVNPTSKTLEAYVIDDRARWVLLGTWSGDKKVRVKPFDAVELELAALWSR
jgi:Uma2 family endonuclease